jgi:hypothetical protein
MQDLRCTICHRAHAEADRVGSSRQFAKGFHGSLLDLGLPYLSPKYRGGAGNQADGAWEEQEESMRLIHFLPDISHELFPFYFVTSILFLDF